MRGFAPAHGRDSRARSRRSRGIDARNDIASYSRFVPARQDQPGVPSPAPLGAGSLAANLVSNAASLIASLARAAGDGGSAAQAGRIGRRARVLSESNDVAFRVALGQLEAASIGDADGFRLTLALGDAAAVPLAICEVASDLTLLAADLADSGDSARRVDYIGIAGLSAAASSASALLVRSNLTVTEDDWRLSCADAAATLAAEAGRRAALSNA